MTPIALLLALQAQATSKAVETWGTVVPKRMQVDLVLDPAQERYSGTSTITFVHSRPVDEVIVHAADEVVLGEVAFVRGDRRWPATVEARGDETWAIRPAAPITMAGLRLPRPKKAAKGEPLFAGPPSTVSLEIPFESTVNTQPYGLYRFEHDGAPYLVTQFEADDAREAFPCIDLPDAKVGLWLTLDVPADLVALGNGPVAEERLEGDRRIVTFAPTPPIPTYAMALAVGPYVATPIDGLPDRVRGSVYTVAGREGLAGPLVAAVAPHLQALETWFGTPYPYRKLDIVAVPEFAYGGMENPGLIVLSDRLLASDDQLSPGHRRWLNEVVSHEIAHMWFGDLVTLKWWDDFWLNESFAEWMGNRAATIVSGDPVYPIDRARNTQRALQADARATMRPVRTEIDPTRIFETTNFLAYPKGEALLTMVETWIGADAFQRGVRRYLEAHANGNATSADLFAALSDASGKDVAAMLGPWLDRAGGPLIRLTPGPDGALAYTQGRFLAAGAEADAALWWTVPLNVRWADEAGVHTAVVLLDAAEGTATLPVQGTLDWLLPTADGIGYLAWTLPPESFDALVSAAPALSAAERASVVGNLDLLATAGVLDGGALLGLLERFAGETDPQVMQDVLAAQGFVGSVLDDPKDPAWAAYVARTRRPWLDRLGMRPADGEDPGVQELRLRLMGQLLRRADDPDVRAEAERLARAFLADPDAVDPEAARFGLLAFAEEQDTAFQDEMLARAAAEQRPDRHGLYLSAAAAVRADGARDRTLALAVAPETPMSDLWPLLFGSLDDETEADRDFAIDYVLAHYDAISAKLPPQFRAGLAQLGAGCDQARWERTVAFFDTDERRGPGLDRQLAEGAESVALCQAQRAAHQDSVRAFLAASSAPPTEP